MTLEEAVRLWINRDFSNISAELIKRAFKDNFEDLELLTKEWPVYAWPAGWGWLFHPDNSMDEKWISDNLDIMEDLGFIVYDSEETGILLGIDAGGFDFYEAFWIPLYKKRGLRWHDEREAEAVSSTS